MKKFDVCTVTYKSIFRSPAAKTIFSLPLKSRKHDIYTEEYEVMFGKTLHLDEWF